MPNVDDLPKPKGWGTRYIPLDRPMPNQTQGMVALRDDRSGTVGVARYVRGPGDDEATRSRRLAKALKRLREARHPAMPELLARLRTGAGEGWLVERFVEGRTLLEIVRTIGEQFFLGESLRILADVLAIVDHLHVQTPALPHGDIAPHRVILRPDGSVALLASGLVRTLRPGSRPPGTDGYVAPEQAEGRLRRRSDLYSVGVLGILLLSGRDPSRFQNGPHRYDCSGVVGHHTELQGWLERMLHPDADLRFPDAGAASAALAPFLESEGAPPPGRGAGRGFGGHVAEVLGRHATRRRAQVGSTGEAASAPKTRPQGSPGAPPRKASKPRPSTAPQGSSFTAAERPPARAPEGSDDADTVPSLEAVPRDPQELPAWAERVEARQARGDGGPPEGASRPPGPAEATRATRSAERRPASTAAFGSPEDPNRGMDSADDLPTVSDADVDTDRGRRQRERSVYADSEAPDFVDPSGETVRFDAVAPPSGVCATEPAMARATSDRAPSGEARGSAESVTSGASFIDESPGHHSLTRAARTAPESQTVRLEIPHRLLNSLASASALARDAAQVTARPAEAEGAYDVVMDDSVEAPTPPPSELVAVVSWEIAPLEQGLDGALGRFSWTAVDLLRAMAQPIASPDAPPRAREAFGEAIDAMLGAYQRGGSFEDARARFLETADLALAMDRRLAAHAFAGAAAAALEEGDARQALAHADAAGDASVAVAELAFLRARALHVLGEYDRAAEALVKAVAKQRAFLLRAASSLELAQRSHTWRERLGRAVESIRQRTAPEVAGSLGPLLASRGRDQHPDDRLLADFVSQGASWPAYDILQAAAQRRFLVGEAQQRATRRRSVRIAWAGDGWMDEQATRHAAQRPPGFIVHVLDALGQPLATERFLGVPAGKALVGSPTDERHRAGDERHHRVVLSHGLLLATTPVTRGFWAAVMGESPPARAMARRPVTGVSWRQAARFCNAVSRLAGLEEAYELEPDGVRWRGQTADGFRLPTEAEWEIACRAATATAYSTGDELAEGDAVFGGRTKGPAVVGQGAPNPWGFEDMHGNVAEWCWDVYGPYPERQAVDPRGATGRQVPDGPAQRVVRGGSWASSVEELRSAARGCLPPDAHEDAVGFRLARTVRGSSVGGAS